MIVTSGGIGANHHLVRANWPARLGAPPERMITGVPAHVDGRMLDIAARGGRGWSTATGCGTTPRASRTGTRSGQATASGIIAGPSSLWLDARGRRFPAPNFPGFDTLGTLKAIRDTGFDHSWFVLNRRIMEKEFALSGSEQNPDLTGKDIRQLLRPRRQGRAGAGARRSWTAARTSSSRRPSTSSSPA